MSIIRSGGKTTTTTHHQRIALSQPFGVCLDHIDFPVDFDHPSASDGSSTLPVVDVHTHRSLDQASLTITISCVVLSNSSPVAASAAPLFQLVLSWTKQSDEHCASASNCVTVWWIICCSFCPSGDKNVVSESLQSRQPSSWKVWQFGAQEIMPWCPYWKGMSTCWGEVPWSGYKYSHAHHTSIHLSTEMDISLAWSWHLLMVQAEGVAHIWYEFQHKLVKNHAWEYTVETTRVFFMGWLPHG